MAPRGEISLTKNQNGDQKNLFTNVLGLLKADVHSIYQGINIEVPSTLSTAWIAMPDVDRRELVDVAREHHDTYLLINLISFQCSYHYAELLAHQLDVMKKAQTAATKDLQLDAVNAAQLQCLSLKEKPIKPVMAFGALLNGQHVVSNGEMMTTVTRNPGAAEGNNQLKDSIQLFNNRSAFYIERNINRRRDAKKEVKKSRQELKTYERMMALNTEVRRMKRAARHLHVEYASALGLYLARDPASDVDRFQTALKAATRSQIRILFHLLTNLIRIQQRGGQETKLYVKHDPKTAVPDLFFRGGYSAQHDRRPGTPLTAKKINQLRKLFRTLRMTGSHEGLRVINDPVEGYQVFGLDEEGEPVDSDDPDTHDAKEWPAYKEFHDIPDSPVTTESEDEAAGADGGQDDEDNDDDDPPANGGGRGGHGGGGGGGRRGGGGGGGRRGGGGGRGSRNGRGSGMGRPPSGRARAVAARAVRGGEGQGVRGRGAGSRADSVASVAGLDASQAGSRASVSAADVSVRGSGREQLNAVSSGDESEVGSSQRPPQVQRRARAVASSSRSRSPVASRGTGNGGRGSSRASEHRPAAPQSSSSRSTTPDDLERSPSRDLTFQIARHGRTPEPNGRISIPPHSRTVSRSAAVTSRHSQHPLEERTSTAKSRPLATSTPLPGRRSSPQPSTSASLRLSPRLTASPVRSATPLRQQSHSRLSVDGSPTGHHGLEISSGRRKMPGDTTWSNSNSPSFPLNVLSPHPEAGLPNTAHSSPRASTAGSKRATPAPTSSPLRVEAPVSSHRSRVDSSPSQRSNGGNTAGSKASDTLGSDGDDEAESDPSQTKGTHVFISENNWTEVLEERREAARPRKANEEDESWSGSSRKKSKKQRTTEQLSDAELMGWVSTESCACPLGGPEGTRCSTVKCKNRKEAIDCPESCALLAGGCANREIEDAQKNDALPDEEKETDRENFYVFREANGERGLKARRNLSPGDFIVEYRGDVISKATMLERRDLPGRQGGYIMELPGGEYSADAYRMGNAARLMNHSCVPNCDVEKWATSDGKPCLKMVASQRVAADTELTFDYRYEISREGVGIVCRCGQSQCRKKIGVVRQDRRRISADSL